MTELVTRAAAGDNEALSTLYQRYAEPLYRVAYRLTASEADAADVLQDVFVGLPRALRSYRDQGSLLGWLKKVTARTALMRIRSTNRRREDSFDDADGIDAAESPRLLEKLELRRALGVMPETLRAAFVLKEIEGYSHAEIAELLETSEAASAARVSRGWKFLRKEIGRP